MMPRRKPIDPLHFGQDPPGNDRPDAIQFGEPGPGDIDQGSDLRPDRGHLRVQRPNIVQVLMGQLAAHHIDRINGDAAWPATARHATPEAHDGSRPE
jgi:hypothetical protein